MTLGIADGIHLLVTVLALMRDGMDKRAAIRESLRINFLPVVITSVTTVIGFLSLNFSDAPPFWYLGNITAVGVTAALLYSVVFLPVFLSVAPLTVKHRSRERAGASGILGSMADWVTARYRPVLVVVGTLTVVLVAFVPTIDLNDEWVKYFDHRIPFRGDAEWGMEHLNGIYLLEFSVGAEGPEGISDPEYLHHLERFTSWLRAQPEVTHVYSYTDVIKRLNKNMHADDPAWYRMPEERELAAQYLLLYELSLPYGLDLNDRISIDKAATRVTATVGDRSTVEFRTVLGRARDWLRTETPEYMWAEPTGASVLFAYISERNITSMLRGNLVAVLLIAGVLIVALRSVGLGTLSLVPQCRPDPRELRDLGARRALGGDGGGDRVGDVAGHRRGRYGPLPDQIPPGAPREGLRPASRGPLRLRDRRCGDHQYDGDSRLRVWGAGLLGLPDQRPDGTTDYADNHPRTGHRPVAAPGTADGRPPHISKGEDCDQTHHLETGHGSRARRRPRRLWLRRVPSQRRTR